MDGGVWGLVTVQDGVLVDQHVDGDPGHVEPVQEVLDTGGDPCLVKVLTTVLRLHHHDSLGHGGDHVLVPYADVLQALGEFLPD